MRIFFAQKTLGLFASSGEYRANISFLRHLASLGHATAQMCFALAGEVEASVAEAEAAGRNANLTKSELRLLSEDGVTVSVSVSKFTNINDICMIALDGESFREAFPPKLFAKETTDFIEKGVLSSRLQEFTGLLNAHLTLFQPTHIIFNDSLSLNATLSMPLDVDARRIFVIHCAEQLPFGPYAGGLTESACSPRELDLLRDVDGIWAVSQAIKDYAKEHGQLETTFLVHDPWTYLDEKTHQLPKQYHNWTTDIVGMINPSAVKGVEILLALAKRLPRVKFAAWKSWGFDDEIRKQLEAAPNIELRPTCRNMEDAWKDIKVLLVPSLWLEAWGMVVVEAQLRGIPVICSDSGALPEAKLGIPSTVAVNSLTGEHDEEGKYIVPDQDIEPWVQALEKLLNDKDEYESVANQARRTTADWLTGLDDSAHEKWLEGIKKTKS